MDLFLVVVVVGVVVVVVVIVITIIVSFVIPFFAVAVRKSILPSTPRPRVGCRILGWSGL